MADDQTNPFTIAGMAGMMMPNPYTQYKGQLPIPGYSGTPTDAQGNPIQSFLDAQAQHDAAPAPAQGMTLNSSPSSGAQFPTGSPLDQMQKSGASPAQMQAAFSQMSPTINGQTNPNYAPSMMAMMGAGGGGGAGAAPAAPPTNPVDMRQAYLTALSNPGKVTTPGANVPQSAPLGTPSVLNAFLAAHPSGGGGPAAGNYSNKGFFDTLNQLRSA